MKPGEPFYIRISVRDILTLLDILEKRGIVIYSKSLAEAMSQGLKVLCEAARLSHLVPIPDESQYAERTSRYRRSHTPRMGNDKRMRELGLDRMGPLTFERARARIANLPVGTPEPGDTLTAAERTRMNHLAHKRAKFAESDIGKMEEFMRSPEGLELDRLMAKDQS